MKICTRRLKETLAYALALSILWSCSTPEPEVSMEMTDADFALANLTIIGKSIAKASSQADFRSLVHNEVEKRFDGETNALIETLSTNEAMRSSGYNTIFTDQQVLEALQAFKGIEGMDYYPQIYIPYFEAAQARFSARTDEFVSPVMVFFVEDSDQELYPGYRLDDNGELIEVGMIDEQYAMNNEVWVISINERYFGEDSISNMSRSDLNESAIISRIKAKCNKESWTAGASEVNVICIVSTENFTDWERKLYGGGPEEGGRLKKIARADIGTWKSTNFSLISNWDVSYPSLDWSNFVIFEYDTWPTGTKTASFTHSPSQVFEQEYRSADISYCQVVLKKDDWPNLLLQSFNNNCITWDGSFQ